MNCNEVIAWIDDHKKRFDLSIKEIPFCDSKEWNFLPEKEALVHKSGRFFAIKGYRATSNDGSVFNQPLIHQLEIGIQAFLVKNSGQNLQVLIQTLL